MLKNISIALIAAALVAGLIAALTWPGEAQQQYSEISATAPIHVVNNSTRYDAGMRIIHVPQAGEVASDPARPEINEEVEPPKPRKRVAMPAPPQPRRILPPASAKRTVLSTPSSLSDGPTPIRPTPRWRAIEKFTLPPEPAAPAPDMSAAAPTVTDTVLPPASEAVTATDTPAIDDDSPPPTD